MSPYLLEMTTYAILGLFGIASFVAAYFMLQIMLPKPKHFTWNKEIGKEAVSKYLVYFKKPIKLISEIEPIKSIKESVNKVSGQRISELLQLSGYPFGLKTQDVQTFSGITSVLVGLIILIGTGFQPMYFPHVLLGAIIVHVIPIGVLWLQSNWHQNKILADIENFLESLQIYIEHRYTLYEAITTATKSTNTLRPYLETCSREWSQGEMKALQNLEKTIGTTEMTVLTAILKQAVYFSPQEMVLYIERHSAQLEKIKEERGKRLQKIKPIIYTAYLALPGLTAFLVGIKPWANYIQNMLLGISN